MPVTGIFRNFTIQNPVIAAGIMDVVFRHPALQLRLCTVAGIVVFVCLAGFLSADQDAFVAGAAVGMVLRNLTPEVGRITPVVVTVRFVSFIAGKGSVPAAVRMGMVFRRGTLQVSGAVTILRMDMGFRGNAAG